MMKLITKTGKRGDFRMMILQFEAGIDQLIETNMLFAPSADKAWLGQALSLETF
jgi:hypothetical protein